MRPAGGSFQRQRMAGSLTAALMVLLLAGSVLPGCVYHAPLSVRKLWFDFNTLGKPALVYEKADRLPPRAFQVDSFRWMYNAGPGEQIASPGPRPPLPIVAPRLTARTAEVDGPGAPLLRGPHPPLEVPPLPQP